MSGPPWRRCEGTGASYAVSSREWVLLSVRVPSGLAYDYRWENLETVQLFACDEMGDGFLVTHEKH